MMYFKIEQTHYHAKEAVIYKQRWPREEMFTRAYKGMWYRGHLDLSSSKGKEFQFGTHDCWKKVMVF